MNNFKKFLYYAGCMAMPHIMITVGLVFLSRNNAETKKLGLKLCQISLAVLAVGFLLYYIMFTPLFGLY